MFGSSFIILQSEYAVDSDRSYEADTDGAQSDDESTIDAQERRERRSEHPRIKEKPSDSPVLNEAPLNHEDEIEKLQREAEMPLEALLEQYVNQPGSSTEFDGERSDSQLTSSTDGSDTSASSGEESDDDRTTVTDSSSETTSPDASLRELLSEDTNDIPDNVNSVHTSNVNPTDIEPVKLAQSSGDSSHKEAEKNLEVK